MHSDGDVESLVKFHSPSARPTVALPAAGEKKAGKRKTAKAYDKAQKTERTAQSTATHRWAANAL